MSITPYLTHLEGIRTLKAVYRDGLLQDTVPFWLKHSVDHEHGGFTICLNRDGSLLDTDKGIWTQGRFTWLLATLYSEVAPNPEWLALAKHGVDFLRKYGFDDDGRMFFSVTRDGKPLRKRRYVFSEAFAVAAFAAYARASGDTQAREEALAVFRLMQTCLTEPGRLAPKLIPETRSTKGLAVPMIQIVTAQILREALDDPQECNRVIDAAIAEIERDFMKPDLKAVLETVSASGAVLDHFDGRMLCPGHAIEAAWFILKESEYRGHDLRLRELGLTILDWMLEWGWDQEYGGVLYYRDFKGLPVQEYWQDMKFWWPHNEAIIATLLAYTLTRDEKYAWWHKLIHDWAYAHFPDAEHGEWFGYLHRDGRLSVPLKGNFWKGPFHLPRMQLVCWKALEALAPEPAEAT